MTPIAAAAPTAGRGRSGRRQGRPRQDPGNGLPAVLRPRPPGRRHRHDHRRIRGRQGHLLQVFSGQDDLILAYLEQWTSLDRAAACRRRGRRDGPGSPAGWPLRRPVNRLPPRRLPWLRLHQRRRRIASGTRVHERTVCPQAAHPGLDPGPCRQRRRAGSGRSGPQPDPRPRRRPGQRGARRRPRRCRRRPGHRCAAGRRRHHKPAHPPTDCSCLPF